MAPICVGDVHRMAASWVSRLVGGAITVASRFDHGGVELL